VSAPCTRCGLTMTDHGVCILCRVDAEHAAKSSMVTLIILSAMSGAFVVALVWVLWLFAMGRG